MIYLDSSVALAEIMLEARRPPTDFWRLPLASSRLLEFEMTNKLHTWQAGPTEHLRARDILDAVVVLEMSRDVLLRALSPFPVPLRTLDGLHLATAHRLREQGMTIEIASYDKRLLASAAAIGIPAAPL